MTYISIGFTNRNTGSEKAYKPIKADTIEEAIFLGQEKLRVDGLTVAEYEFTWAEQDRTYNRFDY